MSDKDDYLESILYRNDDFSRILGLAHTRAHSLGDEFMIRIIGRLLELSREQEGDN